MTANDVLRSLRYTLDLSNRHLTDIFRLTGYEIATDELEALLKAEDEDGYLACNHAVLTHFLDGLIIQRRGQQNGKPYEAPKGRTRLTNNDTLKKIRIAFELHEEDMLDTFQLAGMNVTKQELAALFRKQGHHNYRECGDQFLRNFLKGLAIRYRHAPDTAF
ncbi:uncharacterized protein YehS (DUF1456 family) [Fluviicoccus keumensis]|uniref:Uncharacterized protein YehS (DUF1456 family) n=1 Tax=Fluviicoccus keumensis TaxID=1435465 RepID=A0A4Q7ZB99_9GAMM|nr:DUF1456 family protein [Fluviicoccus keumensis]RZU47401.1 uncharacterized protein YehS (DUF1456 family) [Fluviicoccus keumensis]